MKELISKLANEARDNPDLVATAALGAAQGLFRYYIRPELKASRMWALIGLGVTAYELSCPDGELLSEGVDRALGKHKLITTAAIGVTALHLVNVLPTAVDPYHQGLKYIKRLA